jgi:hypothetical protein
VGAGVTGACACGVGCGGGGGAVSTTIGAFASALASPLTAPEAGRLPALTFFGRARNE